MNYMEFNNLMGLELAGVQLTHTPRQWKVQVLCP